VYGNITDSLFHHYRFSNTTADENSSNSNATVMTGVNSPAGVNGNFLQGLSSLGQAIGMNDSQYLNVSIQGTQFRTIAFWFNGTRTGAIAGIASQRYNTTEVPGVYALYQDANGNLILSSWYGDGGSSDLLEPVSPSIKINNGKWQHIVLKIDGQIIKLFINNTMVANKTLTGTQVFGSTSNHTGDFHRLGMFCENQLCPYPYETSPAINVMFDDVRYYANNISDGNCQNGTVCSGGAVTDLYNLGFPDAIAPLVTINNPSNGSNFTQISQANSEAGKNLRH